VQAGSEYASKVIEPVGSNAAARVATSLADAPTTMALGETVAAMVGLASSTVSGVCGLVDARYNYLSRVQGATPGFVSPAAKRCA